MDGTETFRAGGMEPTEMEMQMLKCVADEPVKIWQFADYAKNSALRDLDALVRLGYAKRTWLSWRITSEGRKVLGDFQ